MDICLLKHSFTAIKKGDRSILRSRYTAMFLFKKKDKTPKNDKKQNKSLQSADDSCGLSDHDELTGVLTLTKFYDDAAECIRAYMGARFAICCTTVGNLAAVNELHGTDAGNNVLREVARILTTCDTPLIVARERAKFVFLTRYSDEQQLALWIENLHAQLALAGKVVPGAPRLYMQTGIYATEGRLVALTPEEMTELAGSAHTEAAKRTHSSYIFYSDQLKLAAQEEKILEQDMHEALAKKQFTVYIQPRYSITTDRIIGGKLISSWLHPERGVIAAYRYIPMFVKNGFIIDLDIYMLERLCEMLRGWLDAGLRPMPMSLNVPRLLVTESEKYASVYEQMKEKYNIPDGLIELEFSERLIDDNFSASALIMKRMKKSGFLCAVENYGSGATAERTLLETGINTVKLSRDFFEDGSLSDSSRAVISRTVEIAHANGILVAATGVPDSLMEELGDLGCDIIQRKLSAMPLSADDFTAILR